MSLNKFTDSSSEKQWMNINCNDIVCNSISSPSLQQYKYDSDGGSSQLPNLNIYSIFKIDDQSYIRVLQSDLSPLVAGLNNLGAQFPLPPGYIITENKSYSVLNAIVTSVANNQTYPLSLSINPSRLSVDVVNATLNATNPDLNAVVHLDYILPVDITT